MLPWVHKQKLLCYRLMCFNLSRRKPSKLTLTGLHLASNKYWYSANYLKPASKLWQFFAQFCSFTFIVFFSFVSLAPNLLSSPLFYPSHIITASLYCLVDLSPHHHLGLSISEVYSLMCKLVRPIWITIHIFALHKNSNIDNNNIIIISSIIIISRNQ